ncbi:hypothetical protein PG991_010366 [Apiospora marii]|uniref:Uncharacterized protein n=1 Tax=Apiospora marii TaxID=335849 RepID=A0ABR1RI95_9PEZI
MATRCGWCHESDHTVKTCDDPYREYGAIVACALHNARHYQSDCPEAGEREGTEWWISNVVA